MNENIYYYINKDGARITVFTYDYLNKFEKLKDTFYDYPISNLITNLIKCQHYNIPYNEYKEHNWDYIQFGIGLKELIVM